jgi:hypothetical protein
VIYVVGLYACLFTDGFPWHRRKVALPVGAALAALALWYYVRHPETPSVIRREWFPLLEPRYVLLAAALVAGAFLLKVRPSRGGVGTLAGVTGLALVVAFCNVAAARAAALQRRSQLDTAQELTCAREGFADSDHRGLYARVAAWQRDNGRTCARTRFVLTVRFDAPLSLQESDYRNIVVNAEAPFLRGMLEKVSAQPTDCDVVITFARDGSEQGMRDLAASLRMPAVEAVGRYGQFAAFAFPRLGRPLADAHLAGH